MRIFWENIGGKEAKPAIGTCVDRNKTMILLKSESVTTLSEGVKNHLLLYGEHQLRGCPLHNILDAIRNAWNIHIHPCLVFIFVVFALNSLFDWEDIASHRKSKYLFLNSPTAYVW